ncbi:Uncharacterised protein [Raoultella planticola]|nr:Uncharacterised protein [Raoultella planticola]
MNIASRKKDNLEITMRTDFPVLIEANGALRQHSTQMRTPINSGMSSIHCSLLR